MVLSNYSYKQSIRGGASYPKKSEAKPDPVLWFPGGDADCGTNAKGINVKTLLHEHAYFFLCMFISFVPGQVTNLSSCMTAQVT